MTTDLEPLAAVTGYALRLKQDLKREGAVYKYVGEGGVRS